MQSFNLKMEEYTLVQILMLGGGGHNADSLLFQKKIALLKSYIIFNEVVSFVVFKKSFFPI